MKIAIIRRRFNPFGGAEQFILRVIQSLQAEGVQISVLAESWQEPVETVDSLACHWIPIVVKGYSRAAKFKSFQYEVRRVLQHHHFDLIQSHERLLGVDICRLGDGIHASWVARQAAVLPWYSRLWLKMDPYHRAVISTEKAMAQQPNLHYVANSRLVQQELIDWYGVSKTRITLIENGIDTSSFLPVTLAQKRAQKLAIGLLADKPTVVLVGSGFARKGAFELVQALPFLPEFQLIIVGKDKQTKKLNKLVQDLGLRQRVLLAGPQKDVRPYLAAADIFCLPSSYDSFPNAVLEALCCGLPAVVTDAVGIAAEVLAHQAGVVCDKTPSSIAFALQTVNQQQSAMAQQALLLSKQYDIQLSNQQWLTLYQQLINLKLQKDEIDAHIAH